ncbi:hypothetical protein [Radiobacillus sp. PE A8.2]|uniref:hypothetical protein n=1 Tax=Radiobacillus sp. PE A8.2 TaxID=3380349 RepID=UPI0038905B10
MSKHFKVNTSTYEAGVKIAKFVPIYYFLLIAKNIFDRYLGRLPVEESFSSIWFISFVADGILILIYILLLKTVSAGLLALSELHATDDEEKSTEVF